MNAYRLAALLAVFLVTGVLTSMLTAEDPQWWQEHLSALGASSDVSGVAFNVTLIVAGVVVTTLAGYATKTLKTTADTAPARRRVRLLEGGIVLIGVLLACVGLLPVDELFVLHTIAASGMMVVFGPSSSASGPSSPRSQRLSPRWDGFSWRSSASPY